MRRSYQPIVALGVLLAIAALVGCGRTKSARRPVQMVAVPPPAEAPHAESSVPAGGATTFEADDVVSCEAEPAGFVRAYATPEALTIVGLRPGQTTVRLRLAAGDVFYLDLDVTSDIVRYRVLTVGEQLALPLEGVTDFKPSTECVKLTKTADGAQLIVLAQKPCSTLIGLTLTDGTTKTTEVVVVGGQRLL